jgi:hypothetical protein
MTFEQCCKAIVAAGDDPKQVKQVNYAVNYAKAGLLMSHPEAIKMQALYIVNNISSWRGDTAKAVREELKRIGKGTTQ